jgi:thiol-disulfide isomerase/thioredoxin
MVMRLVRWNLIALAVVLGTAVVAVAQEPSLAGRWDATVVVNDLEIPFPFEITEDSGGVMGSFFNGDLAITSTEGMRDSGRLVLTFAQYASKIEATYADGQLDGQYLRGSRPAYVFRAVRAVESVAESSDAPSIAGLWTIPIESSKGEKAWRFIVRQTGAQVSAAILRVDGDTGDLTGSYQDGAFVVSHFSGARPQLLEITLREDGSLRLLQNRERELVAVRSDSARATGLDEPTDPSRHTSVTNPDEPFRFSFPALDGTIVTDEDPRFDGKVLLVNITGSWCPNCHDEAPFLSTLYKTYRDQGLEIVALSFEDEEQLANPTRLRAFIEKYDLPYTVLLAGIPDQVGEKVPQAVNLNAFPTTFMLGRDGRVRAVHAGFPSPASGSFYTETQREITSQIERLLAEPETSH